ncbi:membrane protein [Grimontia sp. AD028]|uniref:porin n=1 Tax=Grimontia sp. AD028 TaxID=1581149 RepID=UPI00061B4FF2|nr:porin [Grimontia sp. AD028]KKD60942.1 membrane protein [Grimontia sp. AD028]
MNKKLIALAVAAVASTSVSAAEIFNDGTSSMAIGGRAEARAAIKDGDMTDNSRVRINVLGTTQIAEGAYGVGFFEREFKSNESKDENRYIYAGIGTEYGLVTYGLNDGSLGMITDFTDIMSYHGAGASSKIDVADRTDNNIAYVGEFGGLTLKANYVGESDAIIDGGYSLGAVYAMENGLAMGLGYAAQGKDTLTSAEESQIEAAISYSINNIYVAALYKDGEQTGYATDSRDNVIATKGQKIDLTGYELAAAYKMGNTKFTTTYNNAEGEKSGNTVKALNVEAIAIDATHYFNDNFRTYVSYNFNLLDKNDVVKNIDAEDELVFGLRYDF